jgi:hypothetical protein
MNNKLYFMISGVIFSFVALMHLARSVNSWVFQIGPHMLLPWMSYVGCVLAGALSIWAFRLATK